ncbi:MAG: hypothetical protein Q7U60_06605, partial [Candidatus Methanoperedens sp.]|nr:hypothetical protein [Candidatus Methanoperedens sp.]
EFAKNQFLSQKSSTILQTKVKINDIKVGDEGYIYTIDSFTNVRFIKNNVISMLNTEGLGIEKTLELAQKQEEKISRILEMVK